MDSDDLKALEDYSQHLDTVLVQQDQTLRGRVRLLLDALATAQRERDEWKSRAEKAEARVAMEQAHRNQIAWERSR